MEIWYNFMLSGPIHRLRTSFTLLHRSPEPQEEAPADTAEQGKHTFVRRGTTRPRKSIDTDRKELLGHDAPCTRQTPRLDSSSPAGRRASTLSSDLLRTKKQASFEKPYLAHSHGGCSCAATQVATGTESWTVMGRRWKTAKFVQSHNELAASRGAPLATINQPRTQSSTRSLQEYRRSQMEIETSTPPALPAPRACCNYSPRDAHPRVAMRSDSLRFPRRGAASKLLPLPPLR